MYVLVMGTNLIEFMSQEKNIHQKINVQWRDVSIPSSTLTFNQGGIKFDEKISRYFCYRFTSYRLLGI